MKFKRKAADCCCLVTSPERYFGFARIGIRLAVPEFQALHDTIAIQLDGAAVTPRRDYAADVQHLVFAVPVVNYDVVNYCRVSCGHSAPPAQSLSGGAGRACRCQGTAAHPRE